MRTTRRIAVLLATAGLVATSMSVVAAGIAAHQVPTGCNSSRLSLDLSSEPDVARAGVDTITDTVTVTNGGTGACDVTGAVVTLSLPDVSGFPLVHILASGWVFPADGGSTASCAAWGATLSVDCGNLVNLAFTFTAPLGSFSEPATAVAGVTGTVHRAINSTDHVTVTKDLTTDIIHPGPVTIVKYTNDADANDPTAADVPAVKAGNPVTWTYVVTNTGASQVASADVHVTDSVAGVSPVFDSEVSGNGDQTFDPGEVWLYAASGTAYDLSTVAPVADFFVFPACTAGGTVPPRWAYRNVGTVTIPGASASDPSSYCNPTSTARITPMNATCQQFAAGTAGDLADVFYGVKQGNINNVSPGGFLYYSEITWTSGAIQVQQSNSLGWTVMGTAQLVLWNATCTKTMATGTFNPATGMVTFTTAGLTAGSIYYLSIKYDPGSLVGQAVPTTPTDVYTLLTYLNGSVVISSQDSVNVKSK